MTYTDFACALKNTRQSFRTISELWIFATEKWWMTAIARSICTIYEAPEIGRILYQEYTEGRIESEQAFLKRLRELEG